MVEIDGVTVTLEKHPCWGLVDDLSDAYNQAIEIVTRPGRFTEFMDACVLMRLDMLAGEDRIIRWQLSKGDQDNMARFFRNEQDPHNFDSLVLAYDSVIQQVNDIRTARQQG